MHTVTSADGTRIAYDRHGDGPAVIQIGGRKTYPQLEHASRALPEVLPSATLRELPGQNHNVAPQAIVPVLAEFVAGAPALAA